MLLLLWVSLLSVSLKQRLGAEGLVRGVGCVSLKSGQAAKCRTAH